VQQLAKPLAVVAAKVARGRRPCVASIDFRVASPGECHDYVAAALVDDRVEIDRHAHCPTHRARARNLRQQRHFELDRIGNAVERLAGDRTCRRVLLEDDYAQRQTLRVRARRIVRALRHAVQL
jgi:hypothetical protein